MLRATLLCTWILLVRAPIAQADLGHPVAVRWWGQAMVSIETMWNLTVVIDPYGAKIGYHDPKVSGDLVLVSHEHGDHNNVGLVGGEPRIVRGVGKSGAVRHVDHYFDRLPNSHDHQWLTVHQASSVREQAIRITSIPAWHDDTQGSQRGPNALFLIQVDGLRIVHCGDLGQSRLSDEQLQAMGDVDVLLIPVGGVYTIDGGQAADIVRQVAPRRVVPMHYKTPELIYDLQGVAGFLTALGDSCEVVRPEGNTLVVSATKAGHAKLQAVVLDFIPYELPAEWETLFAAKEKSCRESQVVFSTLSAAQMNFKPSNGTHTPRWNAEHMMGRELAFFSEIYRQIDPAVAKIDLNPKQMPPDYIAAHPDWSGAEEARQIERVSAFTRRFAYLLAGLQLDERAPGSRWTPRRLLQQMDRHYREHTANVKQKFELSDWPASQD